MKAYVNLNLFISYTNDTKAESEIAEKIINEVNKTIIEPLGISLNIVRWTGLIPLSVNAPEETIQDKINEYLEHCEIIVIIANKRYGTITKGRSRSNFDIEVTKAIAMLEERKSAGKGITILSYFRKLPSGFEKSDQVKRALKLRDKIQRGNVISIEYSDLSHFKDIFTHDLYRAILRFSHSSKKKSSLRKFWDLGIGEEQNVPRLAIVYPLVDRQFLTQTSRIIPLWHQKIFPEIAYTEYKAINKIVKTLRLVGHIDFDTYDGQNIPDSIDEMNRIWICLPRNVRGLSRLRLYDKMSRFKFEPRNVEQDGYILWRDTIEKTAYFKIESPLKHYLAEQRDPSDKEWSRGCLNIIAKDYAILARFEVTDYKATETKGHLQEYFLAGIRGLGTWGAAWYIDRRYLAFEKIKGNYQILLEITYEGGRIHSVQDVSEKPQEYFTDQLNINKIRAYIDTYNMSRGIHKREEG